MAHNSLLTNANRVRKRMVVDPTSPLCLEEEDVSHALCSCVKVCEVWRKITEGKGPTGFFDGEFGN